MALEAYLNAKAMIGIRLREKSSRWFPNGMKKYGFRVEFAGDGLLGEKS